MLQEKRIDDDWNGDVNRSFTYSWKGFTKFTLLREEHPEGFMLSGERLTKIEATTRPDNLWPDAWSSKGKTAQNKAKQSWANEKPKPDNARILSGRFQGNR